MAEELEITLPNPELQMLRNNKISGFNYRERRHADWTENYTLYRDRVIVNRLIQRQSVNLPLMKQSIRTLLKDVDDMPVIFFENLDNDKQAQLNKNAYWEETVRVNNMEIQDIVDKKQVFFFGRSFDQWQIVNGKVKMTVEDPMDMLVDRYGDPTDIDSYRNLIHTHIFKPLKVVEADPSYNKEEIQKLKEFHATEAGLIKNKTNTQSLIDKNQKMADMGLSDVDAPILGETYVELSLHFVMRKEEGDKEEQIYLYVEADDMAILFKDTLENVIGVTKDHFWRDHYPYCTWADDVERQDFWSDAVADIIRPVNKVLNAWFSQLVENRTLRNFGMHYYDSTKTADGFMPQSFVPQSWGWYGVPGKPSEVLQKVDIPDLSESLDEMAFVVTMIEKATGATATQQGVETKNQVTLGEVKLALGEAKERIKGMSKFYTKAWERRGLLFSKLIEASPEKLDPVMIFKKGLQTSNIHKKEITPKDWLTENGDRCKVWSREEKIMKDTDSLQKLAVVKVEMMDNPKFGEIYKRKLLEFADLSPDETNEIMSYEERKNEYMMSSVGNGMVGQTTPPNAQPQLTAPMQPVV